MPDPTTCEHQWGGNHHDGDTGYVCKLCDATGHYDPDQSAVVADTPAPAPAPANG